MNGQTKELLYEQRAPLIVTSEVSSEGKLRETTSGSPKRVLFVVDTLNLGGTETQTVQVAEQLHATGFHVTVACLHSDGALTERLEQAGIRVVRYVTQGTLLSYRGAKQLLRLAWFMHRGKFDVVHAHDLWANLMGVPAARLAGVPIVLSSQRDLAHLWWYTPARTWVIRLIHRLATRVIANSEAVRNYVVTQFRIPPECVSVLHNAVDFGRFARARGNFERLFPEITTENKLVAVVANMHSAVKGHRDLIEAAQLICHAIPSVKFVLVGEGEQRCKIQEEVTSLDLDDNFLFLGSRQDIPELLSCCDLSVLPSRAEGFPNAVLESMAAGLAVVATRVGGTTEMIEDGVSGVLVPPQDPQALAEAILRLLRDPQLARRLARAGQEQVRKRYSFDRLLLQLQEIYGNPDLDSQEASKKSRDTIVKTNLG